MIDTIEITPKTMKMTHLVIDVIVNVIEEVVGIGVVVEAKVDLGEEEEV